MHRLFILFLACFVLFALLPSAFPPKRDLIYKLNLAHDNQSCCDAKKVAEANGNFDENAATAVFDNQVVTYPKNSLAYQYNQTDQNNVLGTNNASGQEKWIDVNITTETETAYEGNKIVMQFPISSGKWSPTPTGTFYIWYKARYIRMTGGEKDLGTFYDLPNVPDDLFFYSGYALHGAYWHNNFGHPMSHGCVNEPLANAHAVFEWAGPNLPSGVNAIRASADNPGTRVVIH